MPRKRQKLAGGLRRGAVLQMSHAFLQRSGTFGRYFVSEEGDLGSSEDTLRRIY
jgi:hypothetical protein